MPVIIYYGYLYSPFGFEYSRVNYGVQHPEMNVIDVSHTVGPFYDSKLNVYDTSIKTGTGGLLYKMDALLLAP